MIKSDRRLTSVLWMTMILLCIIVVCLMVYLWAEKEIQSTRSRINSMRSTYLSSQKQNLKNQVSQSIDYIRQARSLAESRVRQAVKARTYEAYGTALFIYNQNKDDKPVSEIKKMVHDALYSCSWDDGLGYYFAEDMQGTELINRNNPELEGTDLSNLKDSKGTYIMKEIYDALKSPKQEGFCSYYWNKPEYSGVLVPKISFVKYFEPFDWVIGNGKYIVDEEEKIKKEVIRHIEQIKYGKDGYIFAGTWGGISLFGPFQGQNMLHITDPNGVKIVQELIQKSKSGGGFVEYVSPKYKDQPPSAKLSYAQAVPEWKWYVGTGQYIDEIDTMIEKMQAQAKKEIKILIFKSALVLALFVVVSFLIVWTISRKIKHNFDMFDNFFKRSASQAIPIDRDKLSFSEFKSLAGSANQMAIERQKSEKALRESEKKYRHLFKNAPTGIYEIDFIKEALINVNDVMCKFSGYSEAELLSMDPRSLFTKKTLADLTQRLKKLFHQKQPDDIIEAQMVKKDGQVISIMMASDYVFDGDTLRRARVVVHDITELKQIENEKIEAEKLAGEQKKLAMVGQIAGKMAHDFNNILGIIMGNAQLLTTRNLDGKIKKRLDLIVNQTLRGRNLTKNLVAFAKDQEPKQEFFKISEKIDLVIALMKKDLENISLKRSDAFDVPDLLADPGMIEHAIVNLLQNAIHALSLEKRPEISIKTYCRENFIILKIKDNGCGIPQTHLKSIYSPSFSLKGSRDATGSYESSIKGTGYGMANVKKYIEQHNGNISVESELGRGTEFTIQLPVINRELTVEEKKTLGKSQFKEGQRILLVEDELDISDVQYTILSNSPCNHKVDVAHNGQMAKDLFDRNTYDLISLDYVLPGDINGMDVYNYIRKTNSDIPVLFISGNLEFLQSIRELKAKDNMIDHVSKPCQNTEYIEHMNAMLDR